jgi:hypothetical protein
MERRVDSALSGHYARLRHLRESFAEANVRLVTRLRGVDEHAAQRVPEGGGWTAAQIGWHVAKVTTRFAGLLSGDLPGAQVLPADFRERDWATIVAPQVPAGLKASPAFEPPAHVTRDAAVAALEASGIRMAQAFDALTIERGTRHGITSPIVGGSINLYQVGEWATAHVIRHNRQAKRALGQG